MFKKLPTRLAPLPAALPVAPSRCCPRSMPVTGTAVCRAGPGRRASRAVEGFRWVRAGRGRTGAGWGRGTRPAERQPDVRATQAADWQQGERAGCTGATAGCPPQQPRLRPRRTGQRGVQNTSRASAGRGLSEMPGGISRRLTKYLPAEPVLELLTFVL